MYKIKKQYSAYRLYPKIHNKKFNNIIINWIFNRYNVKINTQNVCVSKGNKDGLYTAFNLFLNKKKYVAIFKPYYPVYKYLITLFKKKCLYINNKNYKKKIQKFFNQINLIIVCSPNNPTGSCANKKFFKNILKYSKKYNIKIISDECYSEIYYKKKPYSIIQFKKTLNNILILNSLSKRSGVPGLRSGFIISNKTNIKKILKFKMINGSVISDFDLYISKKLWSDETHVKQIRQQYNLKIKLCYNIFKKNKIDFSKPKAGFYLWIKINKNCRQFCKKLYKSHCIKILPGTVFGKKNYIRIALTEKKKICLKAVNKIVKTLNGKN